MLKCYSQKVKFNYTFGSFTFNYTASEHLSQVNIKGLRNRIC